ncbi:MAG: hypothetical protein FWD94_03390 [Treponema sp.]|nr:hypothetical protein [Treponema sp.]
MTKRILVAGNESALLNAVELEVAARVRQYAVAPIVGRFSWQGGGRRVPEAEPVSTFGTGRPDRVAGSGWNPGSAISSRALILAAENRLGPIDRAIFVCCPPTCPLPLAELGPADIEILVNEQIKGWLLLARELTGLFAKRQQTSLILAWHELPAKPGDRNAGTEPFASLTLAAFRALAGSLLVAATDENTVQGFTSSESGNDSAFASFIFKCLDDPKRQQNGKIHRFGKPVFLSEVFGRN